MKQKKMVLEYEEYDRREELGGQDRALLESADKAARRSYSPYSHFRVGAAILLDNGEIVEGSNQENAAYPSGLCAERVALFYASSKFPDVPVRAIALTAGSEDFELQGPVTPCGSCRQVIAESQVRQEMKIRIIMSGPNGRVIVANGIENLLPFLFHLDELKR